MEYKQFRSAGPMTLLDPTEEDISSLRQVVLRPGNKIQYLAFYYPKAEDRGTLHVLAYSGSQKPTINGWRERVHPRLDGITHAKNLRSLIIAASYAHGFEQFGSFRGCFKQVVKPVQLPTKQEEPAGERKCIFDDMSPADYMAYLRQLGYKRRTPLER